MSKSKTKGGHLNNINPAGSKQQGAAKIPSLSAEALFLFAAHFELPAGTRRESAAGNPGYYSRIE